MDARGFFYVLIGGLFGASTVLFYFLVLTAQAPDPLRCMQQLECVDGKVHGTCGPAVGLHLLHLAHLPSGSCAHR